MLLHLVARRLALDPAQQLAAGLVFPYTHTHTHTHTHILACMHAYVRGESTCLALVFSPYSPQYKFNVRERNRTPSTRRSLTIASLTFS